MKRIWLFTFAVIIILNSCNGQLLKKEKVDDTTKLKSPYTDIKVNKEYDEEGNLIRFDSSYTYYYSNIENNDSLSDSIFYEFKKKFNFAYPFSDKAFFEDFFFMDTLMPYDFYKEDFFLERFKQNMYRMEKLFWEMDSIKNNFFWDQFPQNKMRYQESEILKP
ncbi:MAG: hypothetical protein K9H49_15410 [Bacteroidales bacterium]|nr:hypothetical protein [Bacteroidales bacterium]MCF8391195.1 hypothetical protein [Bacteroidales bacterium]